MMNIEYKTLTNNSTMLFLYIHTRVLKMVVYYLAAFLLASVAAICPKSNPNIVFFLADDLGWSDVSFHGSSQIPTPNLDTLAADGVILNNYYVQPLCTPSRAALMTGLYPIRTGMQGYPIGIAQRWGLPENVRIMPQYLKELGYETHLVGKWHLGYYKESITPNHRGFDSFYGFYNEGEDYYTHNLSYASHVGHDFWLNREPLFTDKGTYSTTLYTRRAEHIISKRRSCQPLFLVMSYQAAHSSEQVQAFQAPQENIDKFPYIGEVNRTIYAAMVDALDQSVGQVVKALNDAHMLESTVIVFSSDNGGGPYGNHNSRGFNWPLRGAKSTLWEGGTRAAAFVWSPLLARRRRVSNELMHITDWLPTFITIAGGNAEKLELDGFDMWRQLSFSAKSLRVELLYNYDYRFSNAAALRNSRYKLVLDGTGFFNERYTILGGSNPCQDLDSMLYQSTVAGVLKKLYKRKHLAFSKNWREKATLGCGRQKSNFSPGSCVYLFDIVNDPCELNNLASVHPNVVASLKKRIDAYRAGAVPTLNNLTIDLASFPENHNGVWAPWVTS
ncbi:arylsulfatase B-like isoform X2 [Dermacentor silvarum]|uniref:arylsulfatase B-like isoform X2 n=1 Tax=Dermacentor silvarum TaxID=543639 RepID=UPI002101D259|nr:arylsulfatase B-like isoform X2 [Dermacentor silvarum]